MSGFINNFIDKDNIKELENNIKIADGLKNRKYKDAEYFYKEALRI